MPDDCSVLLYCNSVPVCGVPWLLFAHKNFTNSYFPNLFLYVVATNAASSFDSTVFHASLTCSVLVCQPGNETIALSKSTYCKKIFMGSPNHENIFTRKFKTQKFYNTKISRSTVQVYMCKIHSTRSAFSHSINWCKLHNNFMYM